MIWQMTNPIDILKGGISALPVLWNVGNLTCTKKENV